MFSFPPLFMRTSSLLNLSRHLCSGNKLPSTIKPSFQVDHNHNKVLPNKITCLSNRHSCAVSLSALPMLITHSSTSFPMARAGDVVIKRAFSTRLDQETQRIVDEVIDELNEDLKNGESYALTSLVVAYESGFAECGRQLINMHLTVLERIQHINNLMPVNRPVIIDALVDIYNLNKLGRDDLGFSESQRLEMLESYAKESRKARREWIRAMLKAEGPHASFEEPDSELLQHEIEALKSRAAQGDIDALDELLEVYNSGYIKIGHKRYLLGLDGLSRWQELEKLVDLNPNYVTTFLAPIYRYNTLDFMGIRETYLNLSRSTRLESLRAGGVSFSSDSCPALAKAHAYLLFNLRSD